MTFLNGYLQNIECQDIEQRLVLFPRSHNPKQFKDFLFFDYIFLLTTALENTDLVE